MGPGGRRAALAALAMVAVALAGCGDDATPERATTASPPTREVPPAEQEVPPGRSLPAPTPDPQDPLDQLIPRNVPRVANGRPADPAELAVVQRWLKALQRGDVSSAADTFADGAIVQNTLPPARLPDRAARLAFNRGFPCGAELVDASSVRAFLVVTYRLTDRTGSRCDGPGGTAAGAIKVEGGKMTEWYRLPDPPQAPEAPAGPVV